MQNTEYLIRLRDLSDALSSINDMSSRAQVADETIEELGQLVTEVSDLIDQANEGLTCSPVRDDLLERIGQVECDTPRVSEFLSRINELLEMMSC